MIYTNRKYLSILTLTENRDYVTYDELIHVLTERPSNAVYIERDGILCGLITSGRIMRSRDEETRRVPFSKKFTSVHPGEYLRARQIFRNKDNVNVLPVVSEDGRLLGDYMRGNDFIGMDYVKLLCKDPYVLRDLKTEIQNAILVKPILHRGRGYKGEAFLWWIQNLESEDIHLQVIQPWEIKDYSDKILLFVDEDEKSGIAALNRHLYPNKKEANVKFITIANYLDQIKRLASARANTSILKALQNQGVFVLIFDFMENSNHFLAVLDERIKRRNEKYSVEPTPFNMLPEELKEPFADELYCEAYKAQEFPLPMSFHTRGGIRYLSDAGTDFLHIQNGERLTVDQPDKYDRCIYLYGPCVVVGRYVSDQYTIPSLLQSEINQAGFSCKVVNRGFPGGDYLNGERLRLESFKRGDIVVLDRYGSLVENFPILNLTDVLEKHDAPADWFIDQPRHCNHKASQAYAHEIYKELVPVLRQPSGERNSVEVEQDIDYIDRFYLSHYFSDFDCTSCGTVGSIVMTCNPFTLGHRYLIDEALKTVDFLIIFVVEDEREDESLFSFQERFAMVCQGTSDLEHIRVVPTGSYFASQNTYPEYFQRGISDDDMKKNAESDMTIFSEKIAQKLGITYRFVGEEREDKVTHEYNEAMKRILPRYGIQVVEIPRKANSQSVISAKRVRYCLSTNRMEELDELIPASTKRILFYEDK